MTIKRFFVWLSSAEKTLPVSLDELDEAIGEYIKHLYQDDLPVGGASDVVCGFKRLYPKCRKSLQISAGCLRNWNKNVSRTQALPLMSDILMSLVVVSPMRGETRLALAFLFGCTCLLRTGEIVSLTRRQPTFSGGGTQLHIALPGSKGAKRLGRPASAMLKQPHIVKFIAKAVEHMEPSELISIGSHASLGRDLTRICLRFGFSHRNLTPYGLRRGGATWLFKESLSYDLVQNMGRWAEAKTSKIYINEAMAVLGQHTVPNWGISKIERCVRVFTHTLSQYPNLF